MNTREVQEALRSLGWPIAADGSYGTGTFEAVRAFQLGYGFANLLVDGQAGRQTHDALRDSLNKGGKCAAHFFFREFKSKGNGWIKVHRDLVRALDKYRDLIGQPVSIVSGYRDPLHNRRIGGASNSQHLYGGAVDIPAVASIDQVRGLRLFSGIGYQRTSGKVSHVDIRGQSNIPATTPGTHDNPMVWQYPR